MSFPIEILMAGILGAISFFLVLFSMVLKRNKASQTFFPAAQSAAKRQFENWALVYTVIWIALFGIVVVTQMYEKFGPNEYIYLCIPLSAPFLLQPIVFPMPAEKHLPLFQRYSFKANVWIAIFSFIGNYWYTHYFYTVLKARYTFSAHRLNDVPIALYFATHFYFVTYHTLSNLILRKIEQTFEKSTLRTFFFWGAIFAFSYFTAFMETLSISSFPYYSFADRYMAYTLGSAFYGIYFIASYPIFYQIDEYCTVVDKKKNDDPATVVPVAPHTLYQTVMEALGCSMLVLCLLDFCRIALDIDLTIPGKAFYLYKP